MVSETAQDLHELDTLEILVVVAKETDTLSSVEPGSQDARGCTPRSPHAPSRVHEGPACRNW